MMLSLTQLLDLSLGVCSCCAYLLARPCLRRQAERHAYRHLSCSLLGIQTLALDSGYQSNAPLYPSMVNLENI